MRRWDMVAPAFVWGILRCEPLKREQYYGALISSGRDAYVRHNNAVRNLSLQVYT